MKKQVTIRLDPAVVAEALEKARKDRRSLDGYIAHLIARDLAGPDGVVVSVTAPDDIRSCTPVIFDGEDESLAAHRNAVMDALLNASGR